MALRLTTTCDKCGSKIDFGKKNEHVCYRERNYNNESIKVKIHHQIHNKKPGDICFCGGNPDCRHCGGSGRIL